ncbi:uncharacterized protein LOC130760127 [Actinidia eriantha]|uniref:uncharacterized protein LOC130760127 n=1 Tax=Actinidia eriantha TaxID=165200 RepID=UPI00258B465C|nr:uncharacterized protein LOC130760127 [Actinidia eriantha]
MLKRLVDVREALATTVVLNSWKEMMKIGYENTREVGALITRYIGSDDFWNEVQNILVITKPIYRLIRLCDKDGSKHRSTLRINVFRSDQAIRRSLLLMYPVPQDMTYCVPVPCSRTATIHVPGNIAIKCFRGRKAVEAERLRVRGQFFMTYGKHCQNVDK